MKLVLHIGTEKTGTTLLQDWLYANKAALSEQGVFLSAVMGQTNNRKIVSYFQTSLDDFTRRNKIHSQAEKAAYFEGFEAEVWAEIKAGAAEHHTMVITSEHFHSRLCNRKEIQALAAFL
jgi:ubiquinone/menaquinone biosynthesis C-methylase UbiE